MKLPQMDLNTILSAISAAFGVLTFILALAKDWPQLNSTWQRSVRTLLLVVAVFFLVLASLLLISNPPGSPSLPSETGPGPIMSTTPDTSLSGKNSPPPSNTPVTTVVIASNTSIPLAPTTSLPTVLVWQHNPVLPQPRGYRGSVDSSNQDYPGTSKKDWVDGVEFSVTDTQILMIAGFQANLAEIGELGGGSDCYLLITRGPISGRIDLLSSGLEIHNVRSSAETLEWAAQKVQDLKTTYASCAQEVDLWVGR
jgi:hypothetical protein